MHQCARVCRMNFSKCTKRPEYTGESQSCYLYGEKIACWMARILWKKLLDGKDLHGKKLLPTSLAIQHLFSIQILAIQQLFPIHILSVRNKSTQEPGYEDTAQIGTNYRIILNCTNHQSVVEFSIIIPC